MKKNYTIVFSVIAALIVLCAFIGCDPGGGDDDSGPPSRTIGSAEDVAKIGTSGYPLNGNYELTDDITLPADWKPIGGTRPFTGTFNGGRHSITISSFDGVDISSAPGLAFLSSDLGSTGSIIARGLFAYIENATVKDLDITVNSGSPLVINLSSTPTQEQFFGTVAAVAVNTAFTNINISGGALEVNAASAGGLMLGGIAGLLWENSSITGCSMSGDVEVSGGNHNIIGGLTGFLDTRGGIRSSFVRGDVSVETANDIQAGGLAGHSEGTIENCYIIGNVRAESTGSDPDEDISAGGLVGKLEGASSSLAVIRRSYSDGTVSAVSSASAARPFYAGGIVAMTDDHTWITDCYSIGAVSANGGPGSDEVAAGGILGIAAESGDVTIERCHVSGAITADGSGSNKIAGGIAGSATSWGGIITDCAVLSESVTCSGGTAKRIVGASNFSLDNNIANVGMLVNSGTVSSIDDADQNGADVSLPVSQSNFQSTLGWDFSNVWKWNGTLPVLKWQP